MNRIIFGDNPFFGVNHISDERSISQSIRFSKDEAIVATIRSVMNEGINVFMCTTHDRMIGIVEQMKQDKKFEQLSIYPCMPYAHKYANAITEYGVLGAMKQFIPGNLFLSLVKGGISYFSKDHFALMELMIDAEMKMFKGMKTPVIFLQNVIADLLLGLKMTDLLKHFYDYVTKKYNAEAGFITMNLPMMTEALISVGINNPIICSSINAQGFRMSGGKQEYERYLAKGLSRNIAMQVFSGGSLSAASALKYICSLPNIESILFGSSSLSHVKETVKIIHQYDSEFIQENASYYSRA